MKTDCCFVFAILIALLALPACEKNTGPDRAPATPSEACVRAQELLDAAHKAFKAKDWATADSLAIAAAEAASAGACDQEIWARARVFHARSIRLLDRNANTDKAIAIMQADIAALEDTRPDLAGLYHFQLAYIFRSRKDFWSALPHYEKARRAHENGGPSVTSQSGQFLYKDLGNIYTRLGENEKAIHLLRIALDSSIAQQDIAGVPDICGDLGWAYVDVGQIDSACGRFRQGLEFAEQHPDPDTAEQAVAQGLLLANWAQAQLLQPFPNLDSAELLARRALDADPYSSGALITLGNIAALRKQYDHADAFYATAETVFGDDPAPLNRELAKLLLQRVRLRMEQPAITNDPKNDLALCQRALQHVLPAFHPANAFENPPARLFYPENTILEALDLKSQVLWNSYRTQPSRQLLGQADSTTALALAMSDTLNAVLGFESSKLFSLEHTRALHERYVQLLFERHTRWGDAQAAELAIRFLEKSRAVLLRQKLASEYALQAAPVPTALRQREDALRGQLVFLKNQLAAEEAESEPDPEITDRLHGQIFRAQEARQRLMDTLKMDFPEYFHARYAQPVDALDEIRNLLRNDSSLFVEYFYNPQSGALYALGVTRMGARLFRGTLNAADLEAFLALVQNGALGRDQEGDPAFCRQFAGAARQLYDTLLAPVVGGRPFGELIVSPDGPLGSLPFDLLLPEDPAPDAVSFRRLPYLLRRARVRFVASATVLRDARTLAAQADGQGYFGAAPGYNSPGFFAPVQFGRACVRDLAGLFRGQLALGAAATREQFCSEAPGVQLLHFYGHGSANGNRPELSYLAFSGGSRDEAPNESQHSTLAAAAKLPAGEARHVLFAHEISLLRLRAGLVVLSACETGLGRTAGSEGIFSLARAFQDAGCPSTAMTLWSVDDQATAYLTRLFLQNIRAGQEKDAALQAAKLAFLDSFEGSVFPYYWSGMVLAGDASPLPVGDAACRFIVGDTAVSCLTLAAMAGLVALILGLIVLIFKR